MRALLQKKKSERKNIKWSSRMRDIS